MDTNKQQAAPVTLPTKTCAYVKKIFGGHNQRSSILLKGPPVRKRGVNRYDVVKVTWKGVIGIPKRTYLREELWIVPRSEKPPVLSAFCPRERSRIERTHVAIRATDSEKVAKDVPLSKAILIREVIFKMLE